MSALSAVMARISRWAMWFAGAGLLLMTAIISAQVFSRFVLGNSLAWSEQAALLLMVWYILPAAAVGVREGFHVRVTLFFESRSKAVQRWLALLSHLLVGLFGLAMLVWGTELVVRTWPHAIPTIGLPRGFGYLPIPLSGLLIALFSLEQGLLTWREGTVEPAWR